MFEVVTMSVCPLCTSDLPDSATECPNCGAVVASNPSSSLPLVCPACGAINSNRAKFCDQCGIRIEGEAANKIALSDEKNFSLEDVRPAPKGTHLSQSAPPVRRSIGALPVWFWVVVAVVILFLVCIGFLLFFGVVYWVLMGNGIN